MAPGLKYILLDLLNSSIYCSSIAVTSAVIDVYIEDLSVIPYQFISDM